MGKFLTEIDEAVTLRSAGKTDAGSAEVQPARDNRLKATNCRGDGSSISVIPFGKLAQFGALSCLKKPDKNGPAKGGLRFYQRLDSLLTVKWIRPVHAEPV
jgi:hypothetical protein